MKKNDYQAPEMEVVKLNKKSTLLLTSCTGENAGGGGECAFGG